MDKPKLRRWARDQEEQEEFLGDQVTERLRAVLEEDLRVHSRNLLDRCRTASVDLLRYEAGVREGLMVAINELRPLDGP